MGSRDSRPDPSAKLVPYLLASLLLSLLLRDVVPQDLGLLSCSGACQEPQSQGHLNSWDGGPARAN